MISTTTSTTPEPIGYTSFMTSRGPRPRAVATVHLGGACRRRGPFLAVLLGVFLGAGCDDGVTPSLSNFVFEGPARDSASVLLLSVEFHDGDGDLGDGTMETFIDQRPAGAGRQTLLPIFLQSGVPADAVEGKLDLVLELNTGSERPAVGTAFGLGIRVTDAQAHTSASTEITLTVRE